MQWIGSKGEVVVTATGSGYFMLAAVATPRDYQCWGGVIWQLKMGREVAARLRHGQYCGEKGSGSCLSNFFASIGGSRTGILSVIFIFLRLNTTLWVGNLSWYVGESKNSWKQTWNKQSTPRLWFDPVQHTLLEPTRRSDAVHSPALPSLSLSSTGRHCRGQDFSLAHG